MSLTAAQKSKLGPGTAPGDVRFPGVLASEWVKFFTLPSQWVSALATAVLILAVAALRLTTAVVLDDRSDPVLLASQLHEGVVWGGVFFAIVAALSITGEYTSGAIRTTLIAVPVRTTMAVAKACVFALLGLMIGSATSGIVLLANWIVNQQGGSDTSPPSELMLQLVAGSGLYLGGVSILAIGLALIIRNPVGTLVTVIILLTVAPLLLAPIPIDAIREALIFLPSVAGQMIFAPEVAGATLSPWGGLGVLATWAGAFWSTGAILLQRRDA